MQWTRVKKKKQKTFIEIIIRAQAPACCVMACLFPLPIDEKQKMTKGRIVEKWGSNLVGGELLPQRQVNGLLHQVRVPFWPWAKVCKDCTAP